MKLDISARQLVEFDIEIEGADSKEIKPRLMLHDKNYNLCFEGILKNKKCIFNIPKLHNVIQNESVEADIEVVYNGKFYKPWSNTIDIEKPVVFNVKENNEPKIKTDGNNMFRIKQNEVKITKAQKGLLKEEADEKAKQLIREFIKMWKTFKIDEQKKMMKILKPINEKWIKWGKEVFEDINNPKANFILSALSTLEDKKIFKMFND